MAIQLHLVAESSTVCSSRSRRPVRKLLVTLLYTTSPKCVHSFTFLDWTFVCISHLSHIIYVSNGTVIATILV